MDKKYAIALLGLIVVAAGAWALSEHLKKIPVDPILAEQFKWKINDLGLDPVATTTPVSSVVLTVAGVDVPIGTYQGICNLVDNDKVGLLSGEASGVICILNGKGKEIGVFTDGTNLSLKQGVVTANGGSLNRTDFTELKKL